MVGATMVVVALISRQGASHCLTQAQNSYPKLKNKVIQDQDCIELGTQVADPGWVLLAKALKHEPAVLASVVHVLKHATLHCCLGPC
jgi:hypothetical protein